MKRSNELSFFTSYLRLQFIYYVLHLYYASYIRLATGERPHNPVVVLVYCSSTKDYYTNTPLSNTSRNLNGLNVCVAIIVL